MKQTMIWDMCLLALVGVVMYGLAGCGNTDATQTSSQPTLTAANHAETEQVTLQITGMS